LSLQRFTLAILANARAALLENYLQKQEDQEVKRASRLALRGRSVAPDQQEGNPHCAAADARTSAVIPL
jgi:hypothetical protein